MAEQTKKTLMTTDNEIKTSANPKKTKNKFDIQIKANSQ